MSEFAAELQAGIDETGARIRSARRIGDDYTADNLLGRLENLLRIAEQHGIEVHGTPDGGA
ncbi:hypothetical protein [Rhizohabitans arisaemae]|uniref:hypothetical protein n=1 Tax=Rhizohabitans arisaemae TaxID=2720610 RepID=UPI0024B1BEE6|nr:hypothetical protein [Rhizohabitans arisaemae]